MTTREHSPEEVRQWMNDAERLLAEEEAWYAFGSRKFWVVVAIALLVLAVYCCF